MNYPIFITLHDSDCRPFPINVSAISTVVHRVVNQDDGPALVCLSGGGKEAVQETVAQVQALIAIALGSRG